jgi:DNA-binding transcriptional LysR family regulator
MSCMNLQDIEAFVAVAETGSVSRAAVRLNLTQPATSRRIQSFEAAVGEGILFNRAVKPAVLTTLGNHVLEHCRRVLAAVAELEACTTSAADPAGELKIGIAHGLGEMVLTTPLEALRLHYARIRLQISSNWSTGLIEEVRSGAIDCAIGLLTDDHTIPAGLQPIALGAEQVVVVSASRRPTKSNGSPWRLRDLAEEDWFLNPTGCGCRAALKRAFDRQQLPMRIAAEIFGEDLQLSLLSRGGGLSLVPRRLFEHSQHREGRQILSVVDFNVRATVTLIRSAMPSRFDSAVDQLVVALRAKLG